MALIAMILIVLYDLYRINYICQVYHKVKCMVSVILLEQNGYQSNKDDKKKKT